MNALEIEKANILGFSDGGNIALLFAVKYPERIKGLILNGANLNGRGVKASVQMPVILGYKIASLFAKRSDKARQNAELVILPGDHFIANKNPAAFNRAVEQFLKKQ